jgi:hypothetical protein
LSKPPHHVKVNPLGEADPTTLTINLVMLVFLRVNGREIVMSHLHNGLSFSLSCERMSRSGMSYAEPEKAFLGKFGTDDAQTCTKGVETTSNSS